MNQSPKSPVPANDTPPTFSFLLRLLLRIPALRRVLQDRNEEAQRLREALAASQSRLARLREELAARDQHLEKLSALAAERESLLHVLKDRDTARQTEIARLESAPTADPAQRTQFLYEPGHFYSPIVDPEDDYVRRSMEREAHPDTPLSEFGIDEDALLRWFDKIAAHYPAHPFPQHPAPGRFYHYANDAFPLADALALLGFLAEFRPRRYVEVGAGYSSCAAIDINEQFLDGSLRMTFIEPHPETVFALLGDDSRYRACVLRQRLQDTPLSLFTELDAGDVLFIDSSHVAKTGSDVLDYLFRILPRLRPGVLVHLHDIFYPFEYPKLWIADQNRSWNEAYFVRAFLCANPSFRVLYLSDWIYKCRRHLFETRMPLCIQHRGGSLWMQSV